MSVQLAASDTYGLPTIYNAIQPGVTVRSVFVFDVLPASMSPQLESLSPC